VEPARTLSWDWHPGVIPENVVLEETAYVETTYSFLLYRSEAPVGARLSRGASLYKSSMLDVGPAGQVALGEFALVHGARIICDAAVEIGAYALISWNVVLMDSYRVPFDPAERRRELERVPQRRPRYLAIPSGYGLPTEPRPVRIGRNVWIGFDACVLPGVTIGEGAVVGARSVVVTDMPPYTVVAGNPARVIRRLEEEAREHASREAP
jgi:acetyltransferase-like isoleucine patch superfamily enzyme